MPSWAVNAGYLLSSSLTGGTLTSGTLSISDGDVENTTLVNPALASGLTVKDIGVAGTLSVDSQLSSGTNILAVTDRLTLAGATAVQFGQVQLLHARLELNAATLTVGAAAVLQASAGSVATGAGRAGEQRHPGRGRGRGVQDRRHAGQQRDAAGRPRPASSTLQAGKRRRSSPPFWPRAGLWC